MSEAHLPDKKPELRVHLKFSLVFGKKGQYCPERVLDWWKLQWGPPGENKLAATQQDARKILSKGSPALYDYR